MALMEEFYKSVLEQDEAAVVLCDLNHIIVYILLQIYQKFHII